MSNINISNYRSVLEIPRIDDKQIVYTFKFVNNGIGQIEYLDLKNGVKYEGRFNIIEDKKTGEILIKFHCYDSAFFNPLNPNDENLEQILGFDHFVDILTKPYDLIKMCK